MTSVGVGVEVESLSEDTPWGQFVPSGASLLLLVQGGGWRRPQGSAGGLGWGWWSWILGWVGHCQALCPSVLSPGPFQPTVLPH